MMNFDEMWAAEALPPLVRKRGNPENVMDYEGTKLKLYSVEGYEGKFIGVRGMFRALGVRYTVPDGLAGTGLELNRMEVGDNRSPFVANAKDAIKILSLFQNKEKAPEFTKFFKENIFERLAQ